VRSRADMDTAEWRHSS